MVKSTSVSSQLNAFLSSKEKGYLFCVPMLQKEVPTKHQWGAYSGFLRRCVVEGKVKYFSKDYYSEQKFSRRIQWYVLINPRKKIATHTVSGVGGSIGRTQVRLSRKPQKKTATHTVGKLGDATASPAEARLSRKKWIRKLRFSRDPKQVQQKYLPPSNPNKARLTPNQVRRLQNIPTQEILNELLHRLLSL